MHISMRVMTGAAAATVLGLATWAPAHADPANAKNAFPIQVSCDNGVDYAAVANGNGAFSPAHDLASTATLIPIAFSNQSFVITDPDGNVVDSGPVPDSMKRGASAHNKNATVHCSYSGTQMAPDGSTFTISGDVLGFVTK